jgi:hypothetical protein
MRMPRIIRRYEVTDAAIHDSQGARRALDQGNTSAEVFANSAYADKTKPAAGGKSLSKIAIGSALVGNRASKPALRGSRYEWQALSRPKFANRALRRAGGLNDCNIREFREAWKY